MCLIHQKWRQIWGSVMEKANPNSLDGIFDVLDYYDLWYKWFIKSNVKEKVKFNKMNKQEQYEYLKKEQVNGE